MAELTITRNDGPDGRTYTTPVGDLPNVTGILGALAAPGLLPWAVRVAVGAMEMSIADGYSLEDSVTYALDAPNKARDQAGGLGSRCHALFERFLQGYPVDPQNADEADPWDNFLEWHHDHQASWLRYDTEQMVYHPELRYAGTLDMLVEDDDGKTVIDFKTGNGVYYKDQLQAAAYANCPMVGATRAQIVQIKKAPPKRGKGYKVIEVDVPRRWAAFQHVLEVYKDMKGGSS